MASDDVSAPHTERAREYPTRPRTRPADLASVLCLLVLSPVCAEYLGAYDDSTGDLGALLTGLLFFVPLYGCPALLLREVARRTRMTWVGMALLAAAFGLAQAGLVDQSIFRTSYRGIPEWAGMVMPTYIEPLGISVALTATFVTGHVIATFCVPIALTEALRPTARDTPWVGRFGLVAAGVLYGVAAAVILYDHVETEGMAISAGQAVVTGLVVAALLAAAFLVGRTRPSPTARTAPHPAVLVLAALVVTALHNFLPATWLGVAGHVVLLGGGGLALWWASRSPAWTTLHTLAVAAGTAAALAAVGFVGDPLIGEVSTVRKYAHNTVLVALLAALIAVGWRRDRSAELLPR